MLGAEQVVDGLDGIEGGEGYLDEERQPVAHGAVPQAWQLQGEKLAAALALVGDEAGGGVDVLGEVEGLAVVVGDAADEVDGIEVGARGEHLARALVVGVDLAALQDLQAGGAVGVIDDERSAAGLADVARHAAHADGSVELAAQVADVGANRGLAPDVPPAPDGVVNLPVGERPPLRRAKQPIEIRLGLGQVGGRGQTAESRRPFQRFV